MRIVNRRMACWAFALAVGLFVAVPGSAEDADFVSHKKCKLCHNKTDEGAQWNTWHGTRHAKAFETLATNEKAKEFAAARGLETPPSESPECLRCHVTGYDAEKKAFHAAIVKEDGVQCESCHGPASLHLPYGKIMLRKKGQETDLESMIIRPDETVCLTCHNDESPAWNPEKYTLDDGTKAGFDFERDFETIAHLNPKLVAKREQEAKSP